MDFGNVMLVSLVHPLMKLSPSVVTNDGSWSVSLKSTILKDLHPANVLFGIIYVFGGISMLSRFVHPIKDPEPKYECLLLNYTLVKDEHPSKTLSSTLFAPVKRTLTRFLQFLNPCSPTDESSVLPVHSPPFRLMTASLIPEFLNACVPILTIGFIRLSPRKSTYVNDEQFVKL